MLDAFNAAYEKALESARQAVADEFFRGSSAGVLGMEDALRDVAGPGVRVDHHDVYEVMNYLASLGLLKDEA